jgi:hypothetical protein
MQDVTAKSPSPLYFRPSLSSKGIFGCVNKTNMVRLFTMMSSEKNMCWTKSGINALLCIPISPHKAVISLLMIQVKDTAVYVVALLVEVNALSRSSW